MIFLVKIAAKKYLRFKSGLKQVSKKIFLCKTFQRGKLEWFTTLTNWNIFFFKSYSEALQREKNQINCTLRL